VVVRHPFLFLRWVASVERLACELVFFPTLEHSEDVSIQCVVENNLVRLPSGIHLPDGTQVRIEVLPRFNPMTGWPDGYFKETAGVLEKYRGQTLQQSITPE
jgi:hypothetical protein